MRNHAPAARGRPLRAPAIAGILALAVAACGGSAASTPAPVDAPETPAASVAAGTEPGAVEPAAAEPTPSTVTVQVDRTVWFAGFKVTLGAATAELEPGRGGSVTIEATFENAGADDATFDGTLNLASNGANALQGFGMDIPTVPGGLSGKGTLAFAVEDGFTFDDAVLTIGRATNQQAVVPLTATAGDVTALEPVSFALTGSGTADDLRLDLRGAEVRADQPWKHGQMAKGTLVLTVSYDASFDSGFAGGFAFASENVALRLPDGTTVAPIADGHSQSIELIGPNSTVKDAFSRFEIEDPAAGEYVLLVRSFGAEDEIPFSID